MSTVEAREVSAWQHAHRLAVAAYDRSGRMPGTDDLGLADTLRRAALAGPTGIAHAAGAGSPGERRAGLRSAEHAVRRIQYVALLARELGRLPAADADDLVLCAADALRTLRTLTHADDTPATTGQAPPPLDACASTDGPIPPAASNPHATPCPDLRGRT
jgi:four helix bundle protein